MNDDHRTPAEHKRKAEHCLRQATNYNVSNPHRADLILQSIAHGLLALGNEPAPPPVVNITCPADKYDALAAISTLGEDAPPKPLPRKRATPRKTTAPKGTSK